MQILEGVTKRHGKPQTIRVDNGPEFISRSLDWWAYLNKVKLDFSRYGKPTDNAIIESFNGRLRQECLNEHWFLSLEDAQQTVDSWRHDYNTVRPHSALDNLTPREFAEKHKEDGAREFCSRPDFKKDTVTARKPRTTAATARDL